MCRGEGLIALPSFLPSATWGKGKFTMLTGWSRTGKPGAASGTGLSHLVTVGKGRLGSKRGGVRMPQDSSPGKTTVLITSRLALGSPLLAAWRAAPAFLQTELGGCTSSCRRLQRESREHH